jgi:hypothetical protein
MQWLFERNTCFGRNYNLIFTSGFSIVTKVVR